MLAGPHPRSRALRRSPLDSRSGRPEQRRRTQTRSPRAGRVFATILIWAALGTGAWACPVCFRMEEGPVTDGVRAAVVVLMGVTTTVLAGFAVFIRGFIRRARAVDLEDR
jgi:hypothetical protein